MTAPVHEQTPATPANSINSTKPFSPLDKALPDLPQLSSRCSSVYSVDTPLAELPTEKSPAAGELFHPLYQQATGDDSSSSQLPAEASIQVDKPAAASTVSLCGERSLYNQDSPGKSSPRSVDQPAQLARTVTIRVLRAPTKKAVRPSSTIVRTPSTHSQTASWPAPTDRYSNYDFKLLPPPSRLSQSERPVSRFSLNSDDEDGSEPGKSRTSSFLSQLSRRCSSWDAENNPIRRADPTSRKRRPIWSPLFSPKTTHKRGRLEAGKGKLSSVCHRFTNAYRRRARMGAASSPVGADAVLLSNSARSCAGPSTPFPMRQVSHRLPSPTTPKQRAVATLQEGVSTLRFAIGKARVKCIPTPTERRKQRTKKAIRVLVEEDAEIRRLGKMC